MKTFTQTGTEIGALVERKNAAYGSSFAVAGDFLRLLFPGGVPVDRFDDALLMVRIFDKQMRVATDKDAFGESPYADIAGYGILGVQIHQQRKDSKTWPGIVSADAETQSEARPGSAAPTTNAKTTTSESAKTASEPSPQRESFFAAPRDANALDAMEPARPDVDARVKREQRNNLIHSYGRWNYRHNVLKCIACETEVMGRLDKFQIAVKRSSSHIILAACCLDCAIFCESELNAGRIEGASLL